MTKSPDGLVRLTRKTTSPEPSDWQDRMVEIAQGWLFSDVPPGALPPTVILPFENPDLHDAQAFTRHLENAQRYRTAVVGDYKGRSVGVLSSKFGAPAVAMTADLVARRGVSTIVGVGYCGGLIPSVRCGDLVLPLAAVRDDGATARYVAEAYPAAADFEHLARLSQMASDRERPAHAGCVVWSTDAVLLETTEKVEHWSGRGVSAVDMECAALFTVARLRGVRAVAVLVAGDNPAAKLAAEEGALKAGTCEAIALALDFASSLGG